DPRLSRMLLAATDNACLYEMLIIVSALSVQDPRDTPADKKQAAREKHLQYTHPDSDFLSWVKLWEVVESQRQDLSQSHFKKFCRDNYLSWMRLREWRETHRQLTLACSQPGLKFVRTTDVSLDNYEAVHRAILAGSLNQLGFKSNDGIYTGSRGRKFSLFPVSALFKKAPRWIVTAELIETSRLYATVAARIEPEWAVDAAEHLLRREHYDVHWEKKRGEVVAFEKISLFGLVLIEKRTVSFASIDPALCREIFIRQALVEGELAAHFDFYKHNNLLISEIRKQEEKQRKPDILVSDDVLFAFYNDRLPDDITGVASLQQWYKKQLRADSDVLKMQQQDIVMRAVDESSMHAFPDEMTLVQNPLPVKYKFAPGSDEDGVTIDVPLDLLDSIKPTDLDWAVPGLVHERCVAMVKGLSKSLRKNFVPVPDFVSAALAQANAADKQALTQILSDFAWRQKRIRIDPDEWDDDAIPLYLRPRIRVLDSTGKQLAISNDLVQLKANFGGRSTILSSAAHPLEKHGLKDWNFPDLPVSVEVNQGITLLRYPAIQDDKTSVSIVLCDSRQKAQRLTQNGLARLLILKTPQQKEMILRLLNNVKLTLGLKLSVQGLDWQENALLAIYRLCFQLDNNIILQQAEFNLVLNRFKSDLVETAERLCRLLKDVYESVFDVRRTLASSRPAPAVVKDIEAQIEFLIAGEFPASVPDRWLWEYPRYLKTIRLRLEKGAAGLNREIECLSVIGGLQRDYEQLTALRGDVLPDFPWQIQELRVSLYAQMLGTRYPVSAKRLARMLEQARLGDIQ
ncbi:MAG: ATP-dependent RNA helicase HrpA, partial [Gammaproteobacteria bacterium]|nr:ATP-dependent RNA helicase HrpA [Gammaproteobacteria bacterium]